MLSVYQVIPDLDNYQYILADSVEAVIKFRFDGTLIGKDWKPPSIYVANPKKPRPDFWGCFADLAVFAVTVKAAQQIVTFLDQSCEALSLKCDEDKFLLCNVSYVVNALDKRKTRHKKGMPDWIDQYSFHSHRLGYSLFKIPETGMSEVLCVEGLMDPEDEFKGTVEKHGLTGLKFKKIWTGG